MENKNSNFEFVLKFNNDKLSSTVDMIEKNLKSGNTAHLISDIYEAMKMSIMESVNKTFNRKYFNDEEYSPAFKDLMKGLEDANFEATGTDRFPGMIHTFISEINKQRNGDVHIQSGTNAMYSSEFSKNELVSILGHLFVIFCWEYNTFIKEPSDPAQMYPNAFTEDVYFSNQGDLPRPNTKKDETVNYSIDDKQIDLRKLSIGSFIRDDNNEFFIPSYQRKYSWNTSNIDELLNGLEESMSKDTSSQYFGAIAITSNKNEKNKNVIRLIDGQQRITTSLIFAKAVYDELRYKFKVSIDDMPDELKDIFSENKAKDKLKNGTKIALELEQHMLEELLDTNFSFEVLDASSKFAKYKNTNVLSNYLKFIKSLEEWSKDYCEDNDTLKRDEAIIQLFRYFFNCYQVATIIFSKDKDEEMQIFENLNSKGMELTIFELIKNTLFLKINSEEYEKNEEKIVELFNKNVDLTNIDDTKDNRKLERDFVFDYIAYQNRTTNGLTETDKDLLAHFNNILDEDNAKNMEFSRYKIEVEKIGKYLEIFKSIKYKTYLSSSKHFLARYKDYLDIFDAKPAVIPYLFYLVDIFSEGRYDADEKKFFIDKKYDVALIDSILQLEKYIIWIIQVNGTGQSLMPLVMRLTKHIDSELAKENTTLLDVPEIAKNFLEGKTYSYEVDDEDSLKGKMPTDEEFLEAVEHKPFYSNFVEIALKRIDLYWWDPKKKGDKELPFKEPSIEHIFPQKPDESSWWYKNEMPAGISNDDFYNKLEVYKDRIGNLLILGKKENSRIKNKDLAEKQKAYDISPSAKIPFGPEGKDLLERDHFNFDDIDARTKVLANILIDKVYK